jgi:hypothetical protein
MCSSKDLLDFCETDNFNSRASRNLPVQSQTSSTFAIWENDYLVLTAPRVCLSGNYENYLKNEPKRYPP